MKMKDTHAGEKQLLWYFLLVFVFSIPFWLLGENPLPLPVNLPFSALGFIVPVSAAAILLYRQYGWKGVRALFARAFDFRRIRRKIWYAPILLMTPAIYFTSYAIMRLAGLPLPENPQVAWLAAPAFFLLYFIGAIGEELGWMGYAVDPLQKRLGALGAGVLLGVVWALWHVIPYLQAHNSAGWIFWQCVYSVALRVLMVWIYNNTNGSVFGAILVHTLSNLCWSLFPNYGSYYDPMVTGIVASLMAIVVVIGWGPKRLSRLVEAKQD